MITCCISLVATAEFFMEKDVKALACSHETIEDGGEEEAEAETMGVQRLYTPKASPRKKSTTLQFLFDLDAAINGNHQSPSRESDFEELLSIISDCSVCFTFTDPDESPNQLELKRLKLNRILSIVQSSKNTFEDRLLTPLFSMISANLFRSLPLSSRSIGASEALDDDVLIGCLSFAWPHLHIVYEILNKIVLNFDPTALADYINQPFLLNLLPLFQVEDGRERESLKNVYHRIYSKLTFHRSFMRKCMHDAFLHFIFDLEHHSGIGEMLEIWGSLINGFSVPIKDEHKLFLTRVLLPLHKSKTVQLYHKQLVYCVVQFVQKQPELCGVVVKRILKYWPITNCQKEVLLISELEELIEAVDPVEWPKLAPPICCQMAKCMNSWNSQVAERALYVWNNEQFVKMASRAMEVVLPAVVASIERNLRWHWSKSVRQLTTDVKNLLEGMVPLLYSSCIGEMNKKESMASQEEFRRIQRWEELEMIASSHLGIVSTTHSVCVSQ